jgi:SH3 domain-containing protein
MKYLILLIIISLSHISLFAQNPTFPPQDETYLDSGLNAFVKNLLVAIDKRDKHFLNDALDFYVVSSVDSRGGLDDFKRTWSPEQDSSLMWPLMKRVIELGGVFLHDTADQSGRYQFVFPYVYNMPLDIEDDYFNIGVITGKNVNLRSGPDTASPIKSKLTYDVVWYVLEDLAGETQSGTNRFGDPEWYMVETYDRSQRGWVNWQYVYSPTGPRLFLYETKKGEWKISAFVSGD